MGKMFKKSLLSTVSISSDVARAVELLRAGRLVAFPTETVYGLGADATNASAVARIFAVKGRPQDHPLIVHIRRAEDLPFWAIDVPPAALVLARRFWPGPLTLILRRHSSVPDVVTGGLDTVGIRVPNHPVALSLLEHFNGGIAAPSANRFGRVSPTEAVHVADEFGDLIDFILDGGSCWVGIESTIVDFSTGRPIILRPGGIAREILEEALNVSVPVRQDGGVRSPGQHPTHYAPRARVILVQETEVIVQVKGLLASGCRVAVMSAHPIDALPLCVIRIPLPATLSEMARQLYAKLRSADAMNVDVLVAVPPHTSGLGLAIADRLRRAAGPQIHDIKTGQGQ